MRKARSDSAHREEALRVLVAPSGFKEGLDVSDVADAMARGVRNAMPHCRLVSVPVFDGGEGFARALTRLHKGRMQKQRVTGPMGKPVDASFGIMTIDGQCVAAIEISAAAGLRLVPKHRRNLMVTTSRGVGELIAAALDVKVERILVGCGDSGVNDGGAGMAEALGIRFLDARNRPIGAGGGALAKLARVDLTARDPRLSGVSIEVCLNIRNMLLGPQGVSRVFGPQKGASERQIDQLDRGMQRYASCLKAATGKDAARLKGGGASGGLGAALHILFGARLIPRFKFIQQFIPLDDYIADADLIITAEGRIDAQTCRGKIPGDIARHAKASGKPVIVLAGAIGPGAEQCYRHGVSAFVSILDKPYLLEDAIEHTRRLLQHSTESLMRVLAVGGELPARPLRQNVSTDRRRL